MAKVKGKRGAAGGANSHIRARLDYLYNAANYLQSSATANQASSNSPDKMDVEPDAKPASARVVPQFPSCENVPVEQSTGTSAKSDADSLPHLPRVFISQMRGVSLKAQLRLPIETKRSYCKRCDTLLVPGLSCVQEIRNDSRGRKKPWADVRVIRCTTCGTEKRFPQTERRSQKLSERRKNFESKGEQNTAT
ncbi:Rpr2-domain-containing protein [Aspergillus avenaceus]|uniref:Rpr2-domain-containing protein n=1 Tax=Aspergillus avenaceus TaxID=36643 RepID=A0A5N6TUS2_ASPAV|nr:Rpr2-domain-containing protein [Aspergillus avenaceus]